MCGGATDSVSDADNINSSINGKKKQKQTDAHDKHVSFTLTPFDLLIMNTRNRDQDQDQNQD